MKRIFSAWAASEAEPPFSLIEGEAQPRYANGQVMEDCRVRLFAIEACSWEEAMAIYHLRQGWEPYRPAEPAAQCPQCLSQPLE